MVIIVVNGDRTGFFAAGRSLIAARPVHGLATVIDGRWRCKAVVKIERKHGEEEDFVKQLKNLACR
jgi:hypothetical protein